MGQVEEEALTKHLKVAEAARFEAERRMAFAEKENKSLKQRIEELEADAASLVEIKKVTTVSVHRSNKSWRDRNV